MKKILLGLVITFFSSMNFGQTTIDFDTASNWIQGTVSLGSYGTDHSYVQGDFSCVAWPALRNTTTPQGSFPGAFGAYSWRLKNVDTAQWVCTIANGGVSAFSVEARAWDNSPSPDFTIESSIDLGNNWDSITTINNNSLGNDDNWSTFNGVINSANSNIMIRIKANGTTERIMIDNFTWSPYGSIIDTIATISTVDMTVLENVGTVTVTVNLNQSAVLDQTVDLVLTSGNAAVLNNYSTQTITFSGGSTSETVVLTVTPGQLSSSSETFDFVLNNASTDLMIGTNNDFQLIVNQLPSGPTACSELYFSEYIETTSTKAIELYNPTTNVVNLAAYQIRRYSNGAATPSATLSLSGNLVPGGTYVIANSTADVAVLNAADLISGVISYNGDDAIELYNTLSSSSADIIGEIGIDPGTSWTVGTGSTEDVTLVRMSTISAGNLLWTGGSDQEWDVYSAGDFSYIGNHTNTSCSGPVIPMAYPVVGSSYCVGDTILFTHNSFGGTAPYSVQWDINGSVSSTDTVEYITTSFGTLNVTFSITDFNSASDDSVFVITVNANPTAGFTLNPANICAGDTAFISSTASGSGILTHSYSVLPSGTLTTNLTGSGYFTTISASTYNITQTVIDFNGCSNSTSVPVVVTDLDVATFASLNDICDYDTISLVNANTNGTWSGTGVSDFGGGNGEFTSLSSGDFVITYTTSGTCPNTATDTVTVFSSPSADFSFTGGITVNFSDLSSGSPSTYLWDFGDGSNGTASNETHTYSADGNYTVCLTVTNSNGCSDSICKTVTIAGVGIESISSISQISFYPNPSNGNITFIAPNSMNVTIMNVIGEVVYKSRTKANETIELGHLVKGSYFVQMESNGNMKTEKLIIQ